MSTNCGQQISASQPICRIADPNGRTPITFSDLVNLHRISQTVFFITQNTGYSETGTLIVRATKPVPVSLSDQWRREAEMERYKLL
ncbi:MAG: hypothetical protein KAG53_04145 [Endozoicomonadaceae bacterium]|nr:hypothetical protein [Endozoicomonadaceae bacterium]